MTELLAEFKIQGNGIRAPGAIVLRKLPKGGGSYEYVTHFRNDQTKGYCDGNYFTVWNDDAREVDGIMLKAAQEDFHARCKRGY